jgi:hypothetical protein
MSNTAVFVGMEQEVSGEDAVTKFSSCTKLDSSKGYRFSDTELSRVVGAKVLGYGMSRDEADMAVKVARNMLSDCMPKNISENLLKVRFVKEIGVEVSTGALEDNSSLADSELTEDSVDEDSVEETVAPKLSPEQEDIRLRLEHTKSLLLYTIAKKQGNNKLAEYYLNAAKELKQHVLDIGRTPEDALSGPTVLEKRSVEELSKSLAKVNEFQKQNKFESSLDTIPNENIIDTSELSIEEDDEYEPAVKKSAPKPKPSTMPNEVKGVKLSDEEFNEVVEDFTRHLAKKNQDEIDRLNGVKKPHPLDNIEFDEAPPKTSKKAVPKSFEVVSEESVQDSDLTELDEQLRLTHFKMILLQVKARRMGRDDLVDKYANKSEALRKQILALGVSEVQDMADIAVVGRMKNSELKVAIEEVKKAEEERSAKSSKSEEETVQEQIEDLKIANNIDQEIINHQKRTGTGTAKERNLLRKKIAERKERIEALSN